MNSDEQTINALISERNRWREKAVDALDLARTHAKARDQLIDELQVTATLLNDKIKEIGELKSKIALIANIIRD